MSTNKLRRKRPCSPMTIKNQTINASLTNCFLMADEASLLTIIQTKLIRLNF